MGIYSIPVYFLTAPTPLEVVAEWEARTGFSAATPADEATELLLAHPAHPTHPVMLGWSTDRLQRHAQLEATLQVQALLPFPTYPATITLDAEPLTTRAHSYLRNVTVAVLLGLGGVVEHPFIPPSWATYPWYQIPPRSRWQRIQSLYLLKF
jgi:hypothetical protein